MGNMFQFKAENESAYRGARDVALCKTLNPELLSFSKWLAKNSERIPLG
jgi:hypothetical protein